MKKAIELLYPHYVREMKRGGPIITQWSAVCRTLHLSVEVREWCL